MDPTEISLRRRRRNDRWPPANHARVTFYRGERRDVEQTARRLFGRRLLASEYAGLAGAPGRADVIVGTFDGGLHIEIAEPVGDSYRGVSLVRTLGSQVVVVNDAFHIRDRDMRRRGLGLGIFRRQLHHARLLSVTRIETTAGRAEDENGYYTWPRFGFDGPLPGGIRPILPHGLRHARALLDLLECKRGRQWWRRHGITVDVTFDMAADSRCWRTFQRYLRRRLG